MNCFVSRSYLHLRQCLDNFVADCSPISMGYSNCGIGYRIRNNAGNIARLASPKFENEIHLLLLLPKSRRYASKRHRWCVVNCYVHEGDLLR